MSLITSNIPFILTYRRRKSIHLSDALPPKHVDVKFKPIPKVRRLLTYDLLEEWVKEQPCIHSGYRETSNCSWTSVHSWTYLHNESMNIFTHLIPAIFMAISLFLLQSLLSYNFPNATVLDHTIFAINIAAAITTWTLSSFYHTMMNHSQHISHMWLRIDYVGILTLILGSFISGIYVGFYCDPIERNAHWCSVTLLTLATSYLVLHPSWQGLKYRPHRTAAFILTALSGFAPIIHGAILHGFQHAWVSSGMPYYLLEGVIYGTGAVFFATRFPESKWPGKFDIWFGSHQIFHVCCVVASLAHLTGVWEAYKWSYANQLTCPARY